MIQQTIERLYGLLEVGSRTNRRRRTLAVNRAESLEARQMLAATTLQAFHRSGQTFITWNEDTAVTGEKYNVYRSASPITTANIGSSEKLTSKWGPLDDNTSLHSRRSQDIGIPATFMINDLGTPLSANQGLFVYTTPTGQSGVWFYAVTQVTGNTESLVLTTGSNSLRTGVTELVATPAPVLTVRNVSGKGRIYTQYMDYAKWNPTFQGYAYNYSVALPDNYDPNVSWPLKLMPHAYGERLRMEPSAEYGWPCIQVFLDDPGGGAPGEQFPTWWYGFAADHNYVTQGSLPTAGRVENFTEQRVLKTIDEVSSMFKVDTLRIHSQGHSMGASGSLSLGIRYANVLSGIFGSEPMTNYASSPLFQTDFSVLWGSQTSNLPIVNNGVHAGPLKKYDGIGVYNWMNHHEQLVNRRGDRMAFLMVGHGKADDVIDWATQGRPFIAALNAGHVGFTAEQRFGWDHNWMSFDFSLDTMFSPADGGLSAWAYPRNVSFPGITNATGSGPNVPGTTGTNFYNMQFEWSVPWNRFHTDLVDTATQYEITIRSNTVAQTADVTPQRRQAFNPVPGATVTWRNINNATGQVVQSGTLIVDADGLVTLPSVMIGTGTGNRFILTVPASGTLRPAVTGPVSATVNQKPTITWTGIPDAVGYDLQVSNSSTGRNVILRTMVTGLNYTPTDNWGIGLYRVDVRSRNASGQFSAWSDPKFFRISTPPVVDPVASVIPTGRPTFRWSNVLGATQYSLMVRNLITGQIVTATVNRMNINTYQFPNSLGLGSYSFSVSGLDASGLAGNRASTPAFRSTEPVTLVSPEGSMFNSFPTLTWLAVPGATSYEMTLRNSRTGVLIASEPSLTSTSWTPGTALAAGDYQWTVRGKLGTVLIGNWGLAKSFNNGGRPFLLTTSATTADRTPTITWSAVTGAVSYEINFIRVDTVSTVLYLQNLKGTSYTPLTDLDPRQYRIWVRAVSSTGVVSQWGNFIILTITSADAPANSDLDTLDSAVDFLMPEVFEDQEASDYTDRSVTARSSITMASKNEREPESGEEIDLSLEEAAAAQKVSDHIDFVMTEWALGY
jgi:hypothetical protein